MARAVKTKKIYQLCKDGEKVIESERFKGLNYIIKDSHLILISDYNGSFSFHFNCFEDLTREIKEILDVWRDIRTEECFVMGKRNKKK